MQSMYTSDLSEARVSSNFMAKVYNWMFAALLISGGTAYYVSANPELMRLVVSMFTPLIILELVFVVVLGFLINIINSFFAILLFLLYSLLNGLTLSIISLVYHAGAIELAFGITAGTFLFMSAYGYFTKANLGTFGLVLTMGLFGLILASVVNFFLKSPLTDYILSWGGVVIFTGLTAYDTQKIKEMGEAGFENGESEMKMSIIGALNLYLDFINLFLYILKLFGSRK